MSGQAGFDQNLQELFVRSAESREDGRGGGKAGKRGQTEDAGERRPPARHQWAGGRDLRGR